VVGQWQKTAGFLPMVLKSYPIGEPLSAPLTVVNKGAGEVLSLYMHAHVGDGLVAVHAATEDAALVARIFPRYVAVKILYALEEGFCSSCTQIRSSHLSTGHIFMQTKNLDVPGSVKKIRWKITKMFLLQEHIILWHKSDRKKDD
jgi:hypothetical protein